MKQNFKLIYTFGNTFRGGVTKPAISDYIRFDLMVGESWILFKLNFFSRNFSNLHEIG